MKRTLWEYIKDKGFICFLLFIGFFIILLSFSHRGFKRCKIREFNMNVDERTIGNLKRHVYKLSSEIGNRNVWDYPNLYAAQEYIEEELKSMGYKVELQSYEVDDKIVNNIIVRKEGKKKEFLVVGAHYDSCFNPGADDNASAVAVLLEVCRYFLSKDTDHSWEFVFFVNEEPPYFCTDKMGSRVYVQRLGSRGKDLKGAIILEMVGYFSSLPNSQTYPLGLGFFYPNCGNFIGVIGNIHSRGFLKEFVKSFKKGTKLPVETLVALPFLSEASFSDHASFWDKGYKAIMVTDTAFYRNPNYHTEKDTHDTLDYFALYEVYKGIVSSIEFLD